MRKRRKMSFPESEMPISAMIDVTFLLLIYFIVVQKPIIEDTFLGINLPKGKIATAPIRFFTIDVCKQFDDYAKDIDIYFVNGRKWNFKDLSEQLISTAKNDIDQTILINCDPNAKHQKLVRLLDACAAAGLKNLNLINDESVRFVKD